MKTQRKRLFFDIEVSPNIGLFWSSGYKINLGTENILKERSIICIAYKWEDASDTYCLTWDKKQSDKKMLQEFLKVANSADELIAHNGDKFDLTFIRTRCLYHKLDMFPKYITIDTLKIARSKFRFNSNKLNYIAQFLGIGQKIHTDFNLWKTILMDNNQKSLDKMVKYCKMDVKLLEKVYDKLRNHIEPKTHFGVIFNQDRGSCRECGSDEFKISKYRLLASGIKQVQLQCQTCGKYQSINERNERKNCKGVKETASK